MACGVGRFSPRLNPTGLPLAQSGERRADRSRGGAPAGAVLSGCGAVAPGAKVSDIHPVAVLFDGAPDVAVEAVVAAHFLPSKWLRRARRISWETVRSPWSAALRSCL